MNTPQGWLCISIIFLSGIAFIFLSLIGLQANLLVDWSRTVNEALSTKALGVKPGGVPWTVSIRIWRPTKHTKVFVCCLLIKDLWPL